jgi:NAD(P)-dependent dehydrogenase (short-subunit alcohol dehydrogenase family)
MKWGIEDIPDQSGRTVIVTGANSGLGLETARALARKGASVIFACRSEEKAEAAIADVRMEHPKAALRFIALDLGNLESVHAFSESVLGECDRLDLLVNNAGVMVPPLGRTTDGFELQLGTNYLGHFVLSARLLPLYSNTPGSRVVTLSSIAHRIGRIDFDNLNAERINLAWLFYGQSKLACLMFAYELQRRLDRSGIETRSIAAHPGSTVTNLQQHSLPSRISQHLLSQPVTQGALPTLYAATAAKARGGAYYGPDGFMETTGWPAEAGSSARSRDVETSRRLWRAAEELTGTLFLPAASG